MPCLFRPFLLEQIFSSNFPCKGKDSICFGFPAGAQESLALVLDELTQLVMGDVLLWFVPFLPGWCGSSSECCSASSSVDPPLGRRMRKGRCAKREFWISAVCFYAAAHSLCVLWAWADAEQWLTSSEHPEQAGHCYWHKQHGRENWDLLQREKGQEGLKASLVRNKCKFLIAHCSQ